MADFREDESMHCQCSFCGHSGLFYRKHRSIREGFPCDKCGAPLRYRHQASVILEKFSNGSAVLANFAKSPEFRKLSIFEPGIIGPFRKYFKHHPNYVNSYFWKNVDPGVINKGVRCEDLETLTFADESFDLIVTSDIFEHIRRPYRAFKEMFRVLKPGGAHIFTVPLTWPLPSSTVSRVDISGTEDTLLLPPVYHGSPTDPEGSLVYTDFGLDIVDELKKINFNTEVHHGVKYNVTFSSEKVNNFTGRECPLY